MSKSKEGRQQVVYDVGEEILTALQAVFQTAQRALAYAPSGTTVTLAIPSNMMVGEAKAERFDHARNSELREQLRRRPFDQRDEVKSRFGQSAPRHIHVRDHLAARLE
ncbi:MAG TPA: hypothetical protein VK512_00220 [Xanthobacteraceae bacterium]|nr:hypothetical protein [Xanthobacteraceae bacterium]